MKVYDCIVYICPSIHNSISHFQEFIIPISYCCGKYQNKKDVPNLIFGMEFLVP